VDREREPACTVFKCSVYVGIVAVFGCCNSSLDKT
jgi:hypothetical protein